MRVELVYAPGCSTFQKALHLLETLIAEERLPIPIELVEGGYGHPVIRINGRDVLGHTENHEHLRASLSASWMELTATAV